MRKHLLLAFLFRFLFSQNEGTIYSTLADTPLGNSYSTNKINPDGLEVEELFPSLRFQDVSSDESKLLLNNSDSIFIYDFESLKNLNVNGANPLFTYYEDFIILSNGRKLLRYSLGDSSESIILDSIVTSLPGPSWIPRQFFILSPDKKDIISMKGTSWSEGDYFTTADSLEIIFSNIQNIEQTTVRTIPYTNCGFYWKEDGYLYFTDEYLYKFNIYDENEPIIQLTTETYDHIIPTNDKYLDKIVLAKDGELWSYDFIDDQVLLLGEFENNNGFFHVALRQTWSPDNQKVAIGTLFQVSVVNYPGNIIIYNMSTGSDTIIQENTYRNNLFWHGDSEQQVDLDRTKIPLTVNLDNAYPNPFNPITRINYELDQDIYVKLSIYDVLGNLVKNLVSEQKSAGSNFVNWNATNNEGQPVSAGMYLYSIETEGFRQTKKMILLK